MNRGTRVGTFKLTKLIPSAVAVATVALTLVVSSSASVAESGDTLDNARDASAAFNAPAAAFAAGYELLTDAAGIACIDMPGQGGMGVHYVKSALVQSGTIDVARPQALVYEVGSNGQPRLVALEYVVLQSAWDAGHSGPPQLFGTKFMLTPAGNRFGLPAFYSLHAWIWKHNPSGTFSPWNPTVRCGGAMRADVGDEPSVSQDDVADHGH
jgi:hypothetical protein